MSSGSSASKTILDENSLASSDIYNKSNDQVLQLLKFLKNIK